MAGLKISEVKKYLRAMEKEELVNEITELIKLYPAVKEYYALILNPDAEKEVLAKYKMTVQNEFFPGRGDGKLRHTVVKKAIQDFQKISQSPVNVASLMLYYPELGVEFTNAYGDIDEQYYVAISNSYARALKYIFENNLTELFRDQASTIMENTDEIGWGFNEAMIGIYFEYYCDDEDL